MRCAVLLPQAFNPDWLFELNWDGLCGVAYVESGACRLASRNGNTSPLAAALANALTGHAFDPLWLDGRDLRGLPLIDRKAILRGLAPRRPSRLLYVDHVVGAGVELFRAVCEQDIEGIVAKQLNAPYDPDAPTWVKIKNRNYSQAVGRHERFEKMRAAG